MTHKLPSEERAALQRKTRRDAIIDAALRLAAANGYQTLTRDGVAAEAGVAAGSVNHEFGTVNAMRDAVVDAAIERGDLIVLAQALAAGHTAARDAPADLKKQAIEALAA